MQPTVLYALADGVARVTLNRPALMNALNAELRRDLLALEVRAEGEAPVLVLTGAGRALACDVVIAAESASFVQAFTRIGLLPDAAGSYWLPRQIGFARAMAALPPAPPGSDQDERLRRRATGRRRRCGRFRAGRGGA